MPLFNESIESIAQAIVTVNRALKAGVIEKEDYKGLNEYLNQQKTTLKIKKSHLAEAKRNLDDELQVEADEFFMDEDDALYKMAEELLEDFGGNEEVEDEMDKQAKAWAMMNDKERAAMAVLASNWQKSQ
jgi:hypothetical protein